MTENSSTICGRYLPVNRRIRNQKLRVKMWKSGNGFRQFCLYVGAGGGCVGTRGGSVGAGGGSVGTRGGTVGAGGGSVGTRGGLVVTAVVGDAGGNGCGVGVGGCCGVTVLVVR
jgi:hypothetical protein